MSDAPQTTVPLLPRDDHGMALLSDQPGQPQRTPYQEFCSAHGVTHGHCPNGCEHRQPQLAGGIMVCCFCRTPIVPCVPEVCNDG